MDNQTAEKVGAAIAEVLYLCHDKKYPDRYPTATGTKTNKGLARTMEQIFLEAGLEVRTK